MKITKPELYNDNFQNFKRYWLHKAQLIIADIPYNIGNNAYASNPVWYVGWKINNWESEKANKQFFWTDKNFNIYEFFHFASKLLKKEPKKKNDAPCMIVFCSFEQQFGLIELAKKHWFKNYINLVFRKNTSSQVLKANMRIVGNCEYALLFYRDKLPKFNNNGKMIMNCMDWSRDTTKKKIHPTQKPIALLKNLITLFTDPWDIVIDPCAWSWSTLLAGAEIGRKCFWFEINKDFFTKSQKHIINRFQGWLF